MEIELWVCSNVGTQGNLYFTYHRATQVSASWEKRFSSAVVHRALRNIQMVTTKTFIVSQTRRLRYWNYLRTGMNHAMQATTENW